MATTTNVPLRWTLEEWDLIAKAAYAMPMGTNRVTMLREGQKVLPKDRQKVIPDRLGGKSFTALKAALARLGKTDKMVLRRGAAQNARSKMAELRRSLAGQGPRMAEAMKKANKSDQDVANATGVHLHSIRTVLRDKYKTMMDRNIAKVAVYLGCNYGWLRAGVDGDMPEQFTIDAVADKQPDRSGAELAMPPPPAAHVFKANGKHHPKSHEGRVEAAMQQNIDIAITSLWSMLPMDAKVMVVARVAELVAMKK